MDKTEIGARQKLKKGDAYRRFLESDCWEHFSRYLEEIYVNAFTEWRDSNGNVAPETKATIKVVDAIFRELGATYNSVEMAKKELQKKLRR